MLNNGQKKAFDKLLIFLESEKQIFTISGGAGTGKSYLIDYIDKNVNNIFLTATTNQASHLIGGITINKYLGFGIKGIQEYADRWNINDIVIIDESSMLKPELLSHLIKKGNKVILFGDAKQLVVGINVQILSYPFVLLTENMRTKNKELQCLVDSLSDSVETYIATDIGKHLGNHLELIDDHSVFINLIKKEKKEFLVLAYTNRVVDKYVEFIETGLSCHKAQGQSTDIVFLDARDLLNEYTKKKNRFNNPLSKSNYLRLLSVSVSRAREKVYMYIGSDRKWEDFQ